MTDLSSPLLPLLGLIGAALSVKHGMSGSSQSSGRQGRRVQSRRALSSGLGGFAPMNTSDLRLKPPTPFNVPRRVPRNVASMIMWDTVKLNASNTFSSSAVIEQNYAFSMSQHPQSSSWLALFDQYSIPQVTIEWDSTTPPGQTSASPMLYTAIDFDNTAAIGTIQRIEDFSSSQATPMNPQFRLMRSVRPTVREAVQNSSGTAASGVGPMWIDSGDATVPFFGIRSILGTGLGSFNTTITIWYCFRNHI